MFRLSLIPVLFLFACEGPAGPAGDKGSDGAAGTAGTEGAAGANGTDGTDGAAGTNGADGVDGQDLLAPTPDNVVFAFAVTNDSDGDHMGASPLTLDFDGTAADATTVVASFLSSPPMLDGEDDGATAWGGFESNVVFNRTGNDGNGTTGATLRAGYDDDYVYFFAQWDEVATDAGFGESAERHLWNFTDTGWVQSDNEEDRAYFMFPITPVAGWDTEGCQVACHATGINLETGAATGWMNLNNPGELVDVWQWRAAKTGPTGTLDDEVMDTVEHDAGDAGLSAAIDPDVEGGGATSPLYQYVTDPGASIGYPVWSWEVVPFDPTAAWQVGDSIPGVFNRTPTGSRADVSAVCTFTTPTWTCEFKRLRNTGNGDDRQF